MFAALEKKEVESHSKPLDRTISPPRLYELLRESDSWQVHQIIKVFRDYLALEKYARKDGRA